MFYFFMIKIQLYNKKLIIKIKNKNINTISSVEVKS